MKKRFSRRALLCSMAAGWLAACRADAAPRYSIIMAQPEDRALVTTQADPSNANMKAAGSTTVAITSVRGIGRMDFTWWTPTPPPVAAIVLHLTGLEQVALTWHDKTVSTAWSNAAPPWAMLVTQTGDETELIPGDKDWPTVTHTADGRFILVPPPSFNADAPIHWQLAWVDFFR